MSTNTLVKKYDLHVFTHDEPRSSRDVIFLRKHDPFQYRTFCVEDRCIFLTSLISFFQACKKTFAITLST